MQRNTMEYNAILSRHYVPAKLLLASKCRARARSAISIITVAALARVKCDININRDGPHAREVSESKIITAARARSRGVLIN